MRVGGIQKSCKAGFDSIVHALWMPRCRGKVGDRRIPQERNSDRMVEQFGGNSVSQRGKEIVEVVQIRALERVLDVPVRQVLKQSGEMGAAGTSTGRRAYYCGAGASDFGRSR